MQSLTASKVITPIVTRDNGRVEIEYRAEFDGQLIGFFPTHAQAEDEINSYVLSLCEQGLIDTPLAALAEQALVAANPVSDPDPEPVPPPWEGPGLSASGNAVAALRTFTPVPLPAHDGEYLEQLRDEASLAVAAINVMLHRAVRERARQRSQVAVYETVPAEALTSRLYRLHSKACDRLIRRTTAHTAWLHEHTCPGVEHPCGASALNAYHAATGSDLETARPITLYYCDKHFKELAELAKPVEQETVCDITFDHHGTPMTYRMREPYAGRFIARLRDQGYAPQAEPVA